MELVLDPAEPRREAPVVEPKGKRSPWPGPPWRNETLARRLSSLEGRRGVLLDISKPRGVDFLDRVEEGLRGRYRVGEIVRGRKRTFAKPAPEEFLANLSQGAHFAILAFADCGICTECLDYNGGSDGLRTCGLSNCVEEALFFERRGIPTALVGTAGYAEAARVQEEFLGLPPYPIVVVRRSILRLAREEVQALADEALEAIAERLLARCSPARPQPS